ncbi:unnamed protein product [Rhizophagus irregularis]|nr:unnamed protein product [Rhizophagus irregularis]
MFIGQNYMNENKYNELHMSDVLLSEQQQLNNKNHSSTLIEGIITDESIGESIGDIKVGDSFSTWEDAEIKLN